MSRDNRGRGTLEQTAESLKLLGAGSKYKAPDPTNKFTYGPEPEYPNMWSKVTGPWQQRHPQGQWK